MSQYNIQACIKKLSMCNQEIGTHWLTHQIPHLLHPKFKLDPLNDPQRSRHFVDPVFRLMRFPLNGELDFYLKMILFIKKKIWLGVTTYFCFIFKRVNKIRKKTLSVTPYLEKVVCEKPDQAQGLGYLSRRYSKNRSTPLSP